MSSPSSTASTSRASSEGVMDEIPHEELLEEKDRQKESLRKRRAQLHEEEKEKALKGIKYLLNISEKYSVFCKKKLGNVNGDKETNGKNGEKKEKKIVGKNLKLSLFKNGTLWDYQVEGVSWLVNLYNLGMNGILADEMGLGKTIQVIAFICHLIEKGSKGPYMIVVPLSTLPNWQSEFKRFAPDVPVVVFYGDAMTRKQLKPQVKRTKTMGKFSTQPVILVTYQGVSQELTFYKQFTWKFIIIDEGHRIKNHNSLLSAELRTIPCSNKLILTGTPLQNNLKELWSLLNFIMPLFFDKIDTFTTLLALEDLEDQNLSGNKQSMDIIQSIHQVLDPFMLRRLKRDVLEDLIPKKEILVYCPLTPLQLNLYKYALETSMQKAAMMDPYKLAAQQVDIEAPKKKRRCVNQIKSYVEGAVEYEYVQCDNDDDFFEGSASMGIFKKQYELYKGEKLPDSLVRYYYNIYMKRSWIMLKEIVDHPYSIAHPEVFSGAGLLLQDETLITVSGKMLVLDALLPELKKRGHKVLIFSTLVLMLDIISDYCELRGFKYSYLNGSMSLDKRAEEISNFNNGDVFVFLLSTRAGGLGINLTAADTVIFVDRDWNPQVDIQAQDRCHRIGQTKPVVVYTLLTKDTIEERILNTSHLKRRLEKCIMKDGTLRYVNSKENLLDYEVLKQLFEEVDKIQVHKTKSVLTKIEVEKLLDRSDLYKQINLEGKKNA